MADFLIQFFKVLIVVPVALLPIINPLSTAPVFVGTVGTDRDLAKRLARQIAINAWGRAGGVYAHRHLYPAFCSASLFPSSALAAACSWPPRAGACFTAPKRMTCMLAAAESLFSSNYELVRRSFFPTTFPLTTGPGTIAASIALGAQITGITAPVLYLAGDLGPEPAERCWYRPSDLVFWNSAAVMKRLGDIGTLVMMRLMAFILLCIGIQMMWTGWSELNGVTL